MWLFMQQICSDKLFHVKSGICLSVNVELQYKLYYQQEESAIFFLYIYIYISTDLLYVYAHTTHAFFLFYGVH